MFAFWALLALPWLWFYFGLAVAFLYGLTWVIAAALVRQWWLCLGLFFVSVVALVNLELSTRHILPRAAQHQEVNLVVCVEQPLQVYSDYFSGNVNVINQPDTLSLRQVRLTGDTELLPALLAGQCLRGSFRLRQPFGRLIPGSFDPDRYFFSQSIDARAQLRLVDEVIDRPTLATAVYNRAQPHFSNQQSLELWSALVLGWSSALDGETKSVLAANQLSHLFVISGFHIAIVAAIAHLLLSLVAWLIKPYVSLSITLKLSCVGVTCLLYVAFLGFPVPALRATIMLAVPLLVMSGKFQVSPYISVTGAMVIITLLFPEQWLGIGSWLSFIAVTAIVMAYRWGLFVQHKLLALLVFQALMTVLTVFFAFLFDMTLSWLGFMTNLIAGPLVAFILFPLALLTALWPAIFAAILDSFMSAGLQGLVYLSGFSSPIEGFSAALVLFIASSVIVWVWLPHPHRLPAFFGQVLFCFAGWVFHQLFSTLHAPQSSQITLFDVGHGLSVLIEHQDKRILYDTGGRLSDGTSFYEAFLAGAIGRVDILIVSHSDSDHAAGANDVAARYPEVMVYSSEALPGLSVEECHTELEISEGLKFIPVPTQLRSNSNNQSCVLLVTLHNHRLLLTGDADKKVEYWLLQEKPELFPLDLVVLGHHGSGHSSVGDWLNTNHTAQYFNSGADRARPQWPDQRIQLWFDENDVQLNNTAQLGTIRLNFSEQDLVIKSQISALRKRLIY